MGPRLADHGQTEHRPNIGRTPLKSATQTTLIFSGETTSKAPEISSNGRPERAVERAESERF